MKIDENSRELDRERADLASRDFRDPQDRDKSIARTILLALAVPSVLIAYGCSRFDVRHAHLFLIFIFLAFAIILQYRFVWVYDLMNYVGM